MEPLICASWTSGYGVSFRGRQRRPTARPKANAATTAKTKAGKETPAKDLTMDTAPPPPEKLTRQKKFQKRQEKEHEKRRNLGRRQKRRRENQEKQFGYLYY